MLSKPQIVPPAVHAGARWWNGSCIARCRAGVMHAGGKQKVALLVRLPMLLSPAGPVSCAERQ